MSGLRYGEKVGERFASMVLLDECGSCGDVSCRRSSHGFASVARASGLGRCVFTAESVRWFCC